MNKTVMDAVVTQQKVSSLQNYYSMSVTEKIENSIAESVNRIEVCDRGSTIKEVTKNNKRLTRE